MNPWIVLLLLSQLGKDGKPSSHAPKWPGKKHPPPSRPQLVRHPHVAPPVPPPVPPVPPVDASPAAELHQVAETHEVLVADAQRIAITLGQSLKPDGLFGPKTAGAWAALARARGLDPSFVRLGPRSARVDAHTLAALHAAAGDPKQAAKAQAAKALKKFGGGIFGTPDGDVYIP